MGDFSSNVQAIRDSFLGNIITLFLYYSNDTNKKYNLQVKIYIFFNFFGFSLTYILIFGTIGASIFDLKGDYFEYFSNRNRNKEKEKKKKKKEGGKGLLGGPF